MRKILLVLLVITLSSCLTVKRNKRVKKDETEQSEERVLKPHVSYKKYGNRLEISMVVTSLKLSRKKFQELLLEKTSDLVIEHNYRYFQITKKGSMKIRNSRHQTEITITFRDENSSDDILDAYNFTENRLDYSLIYGKDILEEFDEFNNNYELSMTVLNDRDSDLMVKYRFLIVDKKQFVRLSLSFYSDDNFLAESFKIKINNDIKDLEVEGYDVKESGFGYVHTVDLNGDLFNSDNLKDLRNLSLKVQFDKDSEIYRMDKNTLDRTMWYFNKRIEQGIEDYKSYTN